MKFPVILFVLFSFGAAAQQTFHNKKGGYQIVVPEKWTTRQDGDVTIIYVPDEGEMDTWKEKLEISVGSAQELTLEEAFDFYTRQDLPTAYTGFKIIKEGEEDIQGVSAKWIVFSFTGSGTVGSGEVSFTLYNLFCIVIKNGKLYMLNGIAEKEYFPKLESDYLKIVRSFQVVK